MENPYKVLGVDQRASAEEIRRAFRTLAKQHHPDLNKDRPQAAERFKAINAAYDLLSDPERRARFDRGEIDAEGNETPFGAGGFAGAGGFGFGGGGFRTRSGRAGAEPFGGAPIHELNLDDLLGGMFGGGQGSRPGSGPRAQRGADHSYRLELDFLTAASGGTRRLSLQDGRTVDVTIPPGTEDGTVLRLKKQGGDGWGGTGAGDALVELRVAPHPHFRRVGDDVHLDVPVTVEEAVLGARIKVPTLGKPVMVTVPAHSDGGTVLRLKGRGIHRRGHTPGDLIVTLRIVLGPDAQDEELAGFLRKRADSHGFDPRRAFFT